MSHFQEGGKEKMDVTKVMNRGMELADLFVNKNYLIDIDKCEPIPLSEEEKTFSALSFFQVDKIVFNQKESINDKLVSVYSALSNFGSSVLLMIVGDERGVGLFLGTRDSKRPDVAKSILKKSLQGNFPGIHILEKGAFEIEELLKGNIPEVYAHRAITSVSIVPSIRNEKDKNGFVQGIEKFIDTMAGEKYTAIFVSSPLSKEDLEDKKQVQTEEKGAPEVTALTSVYLVRESIQEAGRTFPKGHMKEPRKVIVRIIPKQSLRAVRKRIARQELSVHPPVSS